MLRCENDMQLLNVIRKEYISQSIPVISIEQLQGGLDALTSAFTTKEAEQPFPKGGRWE